jgi:hypothetical protein
MGALKYTTQCSLNSLERQFVRRLLKDTIRTEIFKNPVTSECDLEERSNEEFSVAIPIVVCRSGLRYHNCVLLILFASERGIFRT